MTSAARKKGLYGLTRRRGTGLLFIVICATLPFYLLYTANHHIVLNEIRQHAMGVAIAVAASIDAADLNAVQGPDDKETEPFLRIRSLLDRVSAADPDIRYIYTMRSSPDPFASSFRMQYVVDQSTRDLNRDGEITRDEESEQPGNPYNAENLPELLNGFERPSADFEIKPDPPYPDLISGYAPIRDRDGRTAGIVGVDITARTVQQKLLLMRIILVLVWMFLTLILVMIVQLYYHQRDAYEQIRGMGGELSRRNDLLRAANEELALVTRRPHPLEGEETMAASPQPIAAKPLTNRVVVDQYFVGCAMMGGDFHDVFDIDPDHLGLYIADVAKPGVGAAIMSGLLRMALTSVHEDGAERTPGFYSNLTRPEELFQTLNHLLTTELPDDEFITMVYAVVDLMHDRLILANAGSPYPILYRKREGRHEVIRDGHNIALGMDANAVFASCVRDVEVGDKVVFYSNGILYAQNNRGHLYGMERLETVVREHGGDPISDLIDAIKADVLWHVGEEELLDDVNLLVLEIR